MSPRDRGAFTAAVCLALLLAGAAMGLRAAREKSLTYDEQFYVQEAVRLAGGEAPCDYVFHPPLAMHLAALGIRAAGTAESPWPRIPFLVLLVATGALAAWWSGQLYGAPAAVATSVLVGLSPNVLATASLATTDLPVAAAMLANAYALRGFLVEPTALRALLWAVTLTLAILSKLTALLLLPTTALVALVLLGTRAIRWRTAHLWPLVLTPLVFAALVWAAYGFSPCGFEALRKGAQVRIDQNQTGQGVSIYVLGQVFDHGVWYYYLVTTALKEPLPFLALLLAACARPVRPRGGWREVAFLLVPSAVVFVVASASIHQLGHRYVLPAFLPLYVWVSGLAASPASRARLAARTLVAAALVLYVADAVRIRPHFIAYTNLLVAPERAYHYLADSNLDWRQDDASPEVNDIHARWDIAEPDKSRLWNDPKPPALLLGATELSGVWVRDGFWGTAFTRRVRERGYEPAMHVAYSQFLFPLDSPALLRDLHDWYLARSWVDAYNFRVRFGSSIGLHPDPFVHVAAAPFPAAGGCRWGVRRLAVVSGQTRVDLLESFAGPPLPEPSPQRVEWSGALRVMEPSAYLLRLAPRAHTLVLGGEATPLHRNEALPDAPGFAALRLDAGLYPFVATQEGGKLDGRLDVLLSRLDFDPGGYATPLPLDLTGRLCVPDARPAGGRDAE